MSRDRPKTPEPTRGKLPNTDQPRIPHSEYLSHTTTPTTAATTPTTATAATTPTTATAATTTTTTTLLPPYGAPNVS